MRKIEKNAFLCVERAEHAESVSAKVELDRTHRVQQVIDLERCSRVLKALIYRINSRF